jgi:predicted ATPase
MAIASLHFQNFKVFKDATLPLGRVTLIIGPNGSGKSTCMEALEMLSGVSDPHGPMPDESPFRSFNVPNDASVSIDVTWDSPTAAAEFVLKSHGQMSYVSGDEVRAKSLIGTRVFSFEPGLIPLPGHRSEILRMHSSGWGTSAVLKTLHDRYPENFSALNRELAGWLPEFNRILLDEPGNDARSFLLQTKEGGHRVHATHLSEGTLVAVAFLTLCHLPEQPPLIGIEDPDRGMHPRLLRDVLDAVHRLSHPEDFGDDRPPVQVVMTTHSPYFLDLFHDRLEDVVIAEKQGLWSTLRQLSTIPNVEDIIRDAHLGESWFNGVLGGVPAHT